MTHVRRAGQLDAGAMRDLLNEVIQAGGTTAMTQKVTRQDIEDWISYYSGRNAWFLIEDDAGQLLGFQWIEPKDALPPEACDIATFTRKGHTQLGLGTKLFEATRAAASSLGYQWINATIRADNTGGLAYYQSRGFETYAHKKDVPLKDGSTVDRISKRYNL